MKLNWLVDVITDEVSYVDKPAIDKRFIALKRVEIKNALPFKATTPLPEATIWDASVQVGKAEPKDLKIMCAWYDSEEPDKKGSYKLPHHRSGDGYPVVWNGVKAAMGALMGARGGVDIPTGDRKAVYNHLSKHYKQWDKEVPEFKKLDEPAEPFFDRIKNLIKNKFGVVDTKIGRVLSKNNENRLLEAAGTIIKAGEIIQSVLSSINKNKKEEEMDEKEIKEMVEITVKEGLDAFKIEFETKLNKLLFEEEKKEVVVEKKTDGEEEEVEKKKKEEEEASKEKSFKGSLLTKVTAVMEKKFEEIKSKVDEIEKELNIKPESDKKKVNKKELEKKSEDEGDFTGAFGLKNIDI